MEKKILSKTCGDHLLAGGVIDGGRHQGIDSVVLYNIRDESAKSLPAVANPADFAEDEWDVWVVL